MFKIDLHTHSNTSHDGGVSAAGYEKALSSGLLDVIAITDHNTIEFAQNMRKILGDRIIVGEEIMTTQGEIVGLFLTSTIPTGLTPGATIQEIRNQNGVVYIPHPFETVRKGLHPEIMEQLAEQIDVVEICNGRAFAQNRSEQTVIWAKLNRKPGAASSDAHGYRGLGRTYTSVAVMPTRENIVELISNSIPITERPSMRALLYPKYNKLRKKVSRK